MIYTLQILRAIAALMVVIYHVATAKGGHLFPDNSMIQEFCSIGGSFGVNLFFLISGFIMYHVTDTESNPWKFIGRRIIRIVPLYWLLLFFGRGLGSLSNPDTYLSMCFIPLNTLNPPFFGWSRWTVGWTLNYEMFFYLLFFLSMFLRRWRFAALFTTFALLHVLYIRFSGGGNILETLSPHLLTPSITSPYISMMINPLGLLFCIGIIVSSLYQRSRMLGPKFDLYMLTAATTCILIFFLFMHFDGHGIQTSFFGLSLLTAALSLERFLVKSPEALRYTQPLIFLGNISYSIYMTHLLFANYAVCSQLPPWLSMLWIITTTIVVSTATHYLIEKRLTNYLKHRLNL